MAEFDSIENLAMDIKAKLDTVTTKKKVVAIYAFNATGKTRLSNLLSWQNENWWVLETEDLDVLVTENWNPIELENWKIKTLCYNAFVEDMFTWDNENYILKFDTKSWFMEIVKIEWLDWKIIDNFKDIVNQNGLKLEPNIDFKELIKDKDWNNVKWEVTFKIASWNQWDNYENIKISKGEESMFIWSVFYTIFDSYIENLNDWISNDLQYVIIDDPVSSIDDTKIITMALKLIETIKKYKWDSVKFLITTHHALFYNVLVNSFDRMRRKNKCEFESYSLVKNNQHFELKKQDDSPFSYHLSLKDTIQTAISNDAIEKYHFNLFRNLLEKTSMFLGYNNWTDCVKEDWKKEELKQRLQIYSHSKLSDFESIEISNQDKELLKETFNEFIQNFNWSNNKLWQTKI